MIEIHEKIHLFHYQNSPRVYWAYFCHSTKQHKARCLHCAQDVKETDRTAVYKESGERSSTEDGASRNSGTEAEDIPRDEISAGTEGEMPTGKAVSRFCSCVVEIGLQPASKFGKREVQTINRLVSDCTFDQGRVFAS